MVPRIGLFAAGILVALEISAEHIVLPANFEPGVIVAEVGDGFEDGGLGRFAGDGGPSVEASLYNPSDIFVTSTGVIYIADTGNHRVRKVDTDGTITTVVGNGTPHNSSSLENNGLEGLAATTVPLTPSGVFVDADGLLVVTVEDLILRVNQDQTVSVIAGQVFPVAPPGGSPPGSTEDGVAGSDARIQPTNPFIDESSAIYFIDAGSHRVRKIASDGTVTTIAGTGTAGYSGDGGQATAAELDTPKDLFVAGDGTIFIADGLNNRVRKVDTAGVISTIAGDGTVPDLFGGLTQPEDLLTDNSGEPALQTSLPSPRSVFADASGNVYVATSNRVRKVTSDGRIFTVAGQTISGDSGDGLLAKNSLLTPTSIFLASDGLHIASLNRIRRVIPAADSPDPISPVSAIDSVIVYPQTPIGGTAPDTLRLANVLYSPHAPIKITGYRVDGDYGHFFTLPGVTSNTVIDGLRETKIPVHFTPRGGGSGQIAGDLVLHHTADPEPIRVRLDGSVSTDIEPGTIFTIAGNYSFGTAEPGDFATESSFSSIGDFAGGSNGEVYLGDRDAVWRVELNGRLDKALTLTAHGLDLDSQGRLIYSSEQIVGRLEADGTTTTLMDVDPGDGAFFTARRPRQLAVGPGDNIYVVVSENGPVEIHRIDPSGNSALFLNSTLAGFPFAAVRSIDIASTGDVYFLVAGDVPEDGDRILKADPSGSVSLIAGNGDIPAPLQDIVGMIATDAPLAGVRGVTVGNDGVYFTQGVLRRIAEDGTIEAVSGHGNVAFLSDGRPITESRIAAMAIETDPFGNLLFTEAAALRRILFNPQETPTIRTRPIRPRPNTGLGGQLVSGADAVKLDGRITVAGENFGPTLVNGDNGSLRVTSIDFEGPDAGSFRVSDQIMEGSSTPITNYLRFLPKREGIHQATAVVSHTGVNGPVHIAVVGTATRSDQPTERLLVWIDSGEAEDLNGDGQITLEDLFISEGGSDPGEPTADQDAVGFVFTIAGVYTEGSSPEGAVATDARFTRIGPIDVDRDGRVYLVDDDRIKRITLDGRVNTVAVEPNVVDLEVNAAGDVVVLTSFSVRRISPNGEAEIVYQDSDRTGYRGLGIGGDGTIYFSEGFQNHQINRIDASGVMTVFAGTGTRGFSGDGGPATLAQLDSPTGIAVDPEGAVYVADRGNRRIRKIGLDGNISTVAGNGSDDAVFIDLPATEADIFLVEDVDIGPDGTVYFLHGGRVVKIDEDGILQGVAGSFVPGGRRPEGWLMDGTPGVGAGITSQSFALDTEGNLYFEDRRSAIKRLRLSGTLSGPPSARPRDTEPGFHLIPATEDLAFPRVNEGDKTLSIGFVAPIEDAGITIAEARIDGPNADDFQLLNQTLNGPFNQGFSSLLIRFTPSGVDRRQATLIVEHDGNNSPLEIALLGQGPPRTITELYKGSGLSNISDLILADSDILALAGNPSVLRRISPAGEISVVAGGGSADRSISQPATEVDFGFASHAFLAPNGDIFVSTRNRILRVRNGVSEPIVNETGEVGFSGDGGPAIDALTRLIAGLHVGSDGTVLFCDQQSFRIRRIDPAGLITTFAGSGAQSPLGDGGPATEAGMGIPNDLVVDTRGNVYVAEGDFTSGVRIRKIDANGIITTVAGGGDRTIFVDGTPGTEVKLGTPVQTKLQVDGHDRLLISGFGRLLRLDTDGGISTIIRDIFTEGLENDMTIQNFHSGPTLVDSEGSMVIAQFDGVIKLSASSEDVPPAGTDPGDQGSPSPDFDGDGTVGFGDFLQFASAFGKSQGDDGYDGRFDLDGDNSIGFGDFLQFATAFGT